jgi:RarD protein
MSSLLILIAIFLWSSLGVVVRLSGVPVQELIFYSMIVSVCIQSLIVSQRKYRKKVPSFKKLIYPAIAGLILLANTFTFFYAYQNTTIANAVLTHYIAPILVASVSPLLLKERISRAALIAIVLASVGLWIMLEGFSFDRHDTDGIIAGLLSGCAYATLILYVRFHAQRFHPIVFALFTNTAVICLLAPFIRSFPHEAVWSFLVMGVVHSTIAPLLYYKGLQKVPANKAAILGYLEPVCAILFGIILLNEILAMNTILGGVLILLAGYLTLKT